MPLSTAIPALYSHFTGGDLSVKTALEHGVQHLLQPRLTPRAAEELIQLQ